MIKITIKHNKQITRTSRNFCILLQLRTHGFMKYKTSSYRLDKIECLISGGVQDLLESGSNIIVIKIIMNIILHQLIKTYIFYNNRSNTRDY